MSLPDKPVTVRWSEPHLAVLAQIGAAFDPPCASPTKVLRTVLTGTWAFIVTGTMPRWMRELQENHCPQKITEITAPKPRRVAGVGNSSQHRDGTSASSASAAMPIGAISSTGCAGGSRIGANQAAEVPAGTSVLPSSLSNDAPHQCVGAEPRRAGVVAAKGLVEVGGAFPSGSPKQNEGFSRATDEAMKSAAPRPGRGCDSGMQKPSAEMPTAPFQHASTGDSTAAASRLTNCEVSADAVAVDCVAGRQVSRKGSPRYRRMYRVRIHGYKREFYGPMVLVSECGGRK